MPQVGVSQQTSDGADALWRRSQATTAPETYLILLRSTRIAWLAAAALEERLAAEDRRGLALVPPVRGTGFAEWAASAAPADRRRLGSWCTEKLPPGAAPVLVGLNEDGLADWLSRLGLAAYIGIPPGTGAPAGLAVLPVGAGPQSDAGLAGSRVRLVPVSTVQELVEAVAAATSPAGLMTAACPPAATGAERTPTTGTAPVWLPGRRSQHEERSALRHLLSSPPVRFGASGLAGALVFMGLSPAAAASAQTTSPESSLPSGSALSGLKPGSAWLSLVNAMMNPRGRHHRLGASPGLLPVSSIIPGGPSASLTNPGGPSGPATNPGGLPLNSINPGEPMFSAANPSGPPAGATAPRGRHHHHRGVNPAVLALTGVNPGGPMLPAANPTVPSLAGINAGGPMLPAINPGGPPVGGITPAQHHHHHRRHINPGGPPVTGISPGGLMTPATISSVPPSPNGISSGGVMLPAINPGGHIARDHLCDNICQILRSMRALINTIMSNETAALLAAQQSQNSVAQQPPNSLPQDVMDLLGNVVKLGSGLVPALPAPASGGASPQSAATGLPIAQQIISNIAPALSAAIAGSPSPQSAAMSLPMTQPGSAQYPTVSPPPTVGIGPGGLGGGY